MFRVLVGIPVIALLLSIILNAILAVVLVITYSSLTEEKIVAILKFEKIHEIDKIYLAHLYDSHKSKIGDYEIYGDQWRIDAGFIKMKYWANIFGVDSKYTLNRLEGRYKNIEEQNSRRKHSYELESHDLVDKFSFFIDTTYGSSTYQDINLNTEYKILQSQTGLLVREKPDTAESEKSIYQKAKNMAKKTAESIFGK
jgi:hypothetical protein